MRDHPVRVFPICGRNFQHFGAEPVLAWQPILLGVSG
jgi:hypothetical protein